MEQLSLPYRIALGAILVFGALYLFVLKPSDSEDPIAPPPPVAQTAPGVAGLGTAVDKAEGAAATQQSSDAATAAATQGSTTTATATTVDTATPAPSTTSTSTQATPAAPDDEPAPATTAGGRPDPSSRILAGLSRGRTAVVLFAGTGGSDDRAVRAAVRRVDRRGGKVSVHIVPIGRVGRYEAITRGVNVVQSPTVLVIGRKKTARTRVGFTTTAELNQLIGDVRAGR